MLEYCKRIDTDPRVWVDACNARGSNSKFNYNRRDGTFNGKPPHNPRWNDKPQGKPRAAGHRSMETDQEEQGNDFGPNRL